MSNISAIRPAQARKPRPLDVEVLTSDELDAHLPFVQLLEAWYPQGQWGYGLRDHIYFTESLIADADSQEWTDIATGTWGIGALNLACHRFGIETIEQCTARMRQWAKIADPVIYPDGDAVWSMPEPAQAN